MKKCYNYPLKSILVIAIFSLIALFVNYFVIDTRSCSAVSSPSLGIFFKFIAFAEGRNIAAKMDEENIEQMGMEKLSTLVVSRPVLPLRVNDVGKIRPFSMLCRWTW